MNPSHTSAPADSTDSTAPTSAKARLVEFAADYGLAPSVGSVPSEYSGGNTVSRSVSEKSLLTYRRRGLYLLNEFLASIEGRGLSRGAEWPEMLPDPREWVTWLIEKRRPKLGAPSWRLYRRCAAEILRLWPNPDPDLTRLRSLVDSSPPLAGKGRDRPVTERKTSAKRAREIPPESLFSLLVYLDNADTGFGGHMTRTRKRARQTEFLPGDNLNRVLSDWIVAGLATGLRPAEWRQCVLSYISDSETQQGHDNHELALAEGFWSGLENLVPDRVASAWNVAEQMTRRRRLDLPLPGRLWLVAYNAKHSNGRGNDDTRSLDLSKTPPVLQQAILRMALRGVWHHSEGDWDLLQKSAARRLNLVQTMLFPGRSARLNLYSCRHQAFANFKSKRPLIDVAVIAGHGDPSSPDLYYSKAFRAWKDNWIEILERGKAGDAEAIAEIGNLVIFLRDRRRRGKRGSSGGYRPGSDVLESCIRGVAAVAALQAAPPPATLPMEARMLGERAAIQPSGQRPERSSNLANASLAKPWRPSGAGPS